MMWWGNGIGPWGYGLMIMSTLLCWILIIGGIATRQATGDVRRRGSGPATPRGAQYWAAVDRRRGDPHSGPVDRADGPQLKGRWGTRHGPSDTSGTPCQPANIERTQSPSRQSGRDQMMSEYEERSLEKIDSQLTGDAPRLATRLAKLDRSRQWLRAWTAALGGLIGLVHAAVGTGTGDSLIGMLVALACGWETVRLVLRLTEDRRAHPRRQHIG
jgi:DUF3040 family protein